MDTVSALLVIVALVALSSLLGVAWRLTTGRRRRGDGTRITAAELAPDDSGSFGDRATLLQFSTEMCARCPATRVLLGRLAADAVGVRHVDVDLTHRPELAARFNILQTPTTFVLDSHGVVTARFGGAPRRDEIARSLDAVLGVTTGRRLP